MGRLRPYWRTFDIKLRSGGDRRVILPVLGRSRAAVLASREISIGIWNQEFVVRYFDKIFPVASRSYARILKTLLERTEKKKTSFKAFVQDFSQWLQKNPGETKKTESTFTGASTQAD